MEFTGTLDEWANVTLGGKAASVDASNNWAGTAAVTTGANTIPLVATDASGNVSNRTISVTVTGDAARTLTYDGFFAQELLTHVTNMCTIISLYKS